MILYDPIQGDILSRPIRLRPKTCFVMTQLGAPVPQEIKNIRKTLEKYLKNYNYKMIDAGSEIRGKDFLLKIWEMILSVPVGIAIISKDLNPYTLSNIFYEMGLLQAYGRETLIVKTKDSYVPSDFVRTEYIEYGKKFGTQISKFLDNLEERSDYYATNAEQLIENPLLTIDYYRRAYLLSGNADYKKQIRSILGKNVFDKQTKSWIETFLKDKS